MIGKKFVFMLPRHPRHKKLIVVLAFMPVILAYIIVVMAVSDHVPKHWLVQLVFYIVAGMAWAFPLKPVMAWMNRAPEGPDAQE